MSLSKEKARKKVTEFFFFEARIRMYKGWALLALAPRPQ
jgi:hypothetical protein